MRRVNRRTDRRILKIFLPGFRIQSEILTDFRYSSVFLGHDFGQPRPPGFSPTRPYGARERERETLVGFGQVAPAQNLLIPREEPFVSQFFCLVRFLRAHNDRKSKIDLLSLQL